MLGKGEGRVFYNFGGFLLKIWLYGINITQILQLEGRFLTEECSTFTIIEFK